MYDTALEEKLLAEIEHDKKSRMAAAMGLKENNGKSNGKKSGKAGKAIRAGTLTSSLMLDQWMA